MPKISYFTLILSFLDANMVSEAVKSCNNIYYKSSAVCTHEISIWRHIKDTNKCRVVRIRLRHQIKYENVWRKFMYPCDWEVDR